MSWIVPILVVSGGLLFLVAIALWSASREMERLEREEYERWQRGGG